MWDTRSASAAAMSPTPPGAIEVRASVDRLVREQHSNVGFSQKGDHCFGQPDPPPRDVLSSPQTPYTGGLRAFGATRVCHTGVTGGTHLAEKVVPSEPVADRSESSCSAQETFRGVICGLLT